MSRDILLTQIDVDPNQPRKHFDEAALAELAQSMAANGLAVPILVRPVGERYMIVHGERRYRAAHRLGWVSIPAEVREMDADAAQWLALVENVQRSNLSPIEEAQAYHARLAQGITQTALAERIGKTQSYIAQKLRLLKLPEVTRGALYFREMTEGHARQLLRINSSLVQEWLTYFIWKEKLTVAQVGGRVDRLLEHCAGDFEQLPEAWNLHVATLYDPDDSEIVKRYGRATPVGWTPPDHLDYQDWLYLIKMGAILWRVQAFVTGNEDDYLELEHGAWPQPTEVAA